MTDSDLSSLLASLHHTLQTHDYQRSLSLLSRAKLALLSADALIPTPSTPPALLITARSILEAGALVSIRLQDPEAFTRYYQQLQPFYDLDASSSSSHGGHHSTDSQRSKITGLYLLLLLSQGDYAGFHTLLEGLVEAAGAKGVGVEEDVFIRYPIELERSLMEGSYDKVWRETKGERCPSEEFGLFSSVLIHTIRSEIASCSEKAYPSLPVSNAKNLLFLDSDAAVLEFAHSRGWIVRDDSRIYFPQQGEGQGSEKEILVASGTVIENTIGYARELETIV